MADDPGERVTIPLEIRVMAVQREDGWHAGLRLSVQGMVVPPRSVEGTTSYTSEGEALGAGLSAVAAAVKECL